MKGVASSILILDLIHKQNVIIAYLRRLPTLHLLPSLPKPNDPNMMMTMVANEMRVMSRARSERKIGNRVGIQPIRPSNRLDNPIRMRSQALAPTHSESSSYSSMMALIALWNGPRRLELRSLALLPLDLELERPLEPSCSSFLRRRHALGPSPSGSC